LCLLCGLCALYGWYDVFFDHRHACLADEWFTLDPQVISKRKFRYAKSSTAGRWKTEEENEDRVLIVDDLGSIGGRENDTLFVCADGHGGAAAVNFFVSNIAYEVRCIILYVFE
jgi:hypothetical protein